MDRALRSALRSSEPCSPACLPRSRSLRKARHCVYVSTSEVTASPKLPMAKTPVSTHGCSVRLCVGTQGTPTVRTAGNYALISASEYNVRVSVWVRRRDGAGLGNWQTSHGLTPHREALSDKWRGRPSPVAHPGGAAVARGFYPDRLARSGLVLYLSVRSSQAPPFCLPASRSSETLVGNSVLQVRDAAICTLTDRSDQERRRLSATGHGLCPRKCGHVSNWEWGAICHRGQADGHLTPSAAVLSLSHGRRPCAARYQLAYVVPHVSSSWD